MILELKVLLMDNQWMVFHQLEFVIVSIVREQVDSFVGEKYLLLRYVQ